MKKKKIFLIISIIIILLIASYVIYTFFPIQKKYKAEIENEKEWLIYIQDKNNWCSPAPTKLYIYENGSYIIKVYKNNGYKIEEKGRIKTLIPITKTINKIQTSKNDTSKITYYYYIKMKDGTEKNIDILKYPHLSHYINKIPNIKNTLNKCN